MGDSQADADPFVGCDLRWFRRRACLAFLADVVFYPLCRASCDSGFRRRVGYHSRHDRGLVGKSNAAGGPRPMNKTRGFFDERPLPTFAVDPQLLRRRTRRDVLLYGAGALAALAGAGHSRGKEWLLNRAIRIDDDVAEALYSPDRAVPTYTKSQITPLKNNYNG